MNDKWSNAELRAAAVEWTLQRCGRPVGGRDGEGGVWLAAVGAAGRELGVAGEELARWCRDRKLVPVEEYRGEECGGEEDGVARASRMAGELAEVPDGALPRRVRDPLEELLAVECDVLHAEERRALAEALEAGEPLPRGQRLALAVLLRGSELASRRDTVRAVLDFIVPQGAETKTIWEERTTMLTAPAGALGRVVEMGRKIPGCASLLGGSMLVIEVAGVVWRALPYARTKRVMLSPNGEGVVFTVRMMVPRETFARDHVLRQFALLASLVREDPRHGKEWGELFRTTKADVSWTKKKLVRKIAEATGSGVGWRQVRHKPDPRKGKARGE